MVVDDADEAARLLGKGHDVVLLLGDARAPVPQPTGGGRLAVLIGDPDDPDARAAAIEMDQELFSRGSRTSRRRGG